MATEAQRRAIKKYEEEKVDRINCRFPKGIVDEIRKNGYKVNAFIIEAVTEKLNKNLI